MIPGVVEVLVKSLPVIKEEVGGWSWRLAVSLKEPILHLQNKFSSANVLRFKSVQATRLNRCQESPKSCGVLRRLSANMVLQCCERFPRNGAGMA